MEELYLSAKNMVDLKYPDGHEYRELFIVGLYGLLCKYREHEKLIWLLFMQLENYFDNKSVNEIIFDNKLDLEAINKSDAISSGVHSFVTDNNNNLCHILEKPIIVCSTKKNDFITLNSWVHEMQHILKGFYNRYKGKNPSDYESVGIIRNGLSIFKYVLNKDTDIISTYRYNNLLDEAINTIQTTEIMDNIYSLYDFLPENNVKKYLSKIIKYENKDYGYSMITREVRELWKFDHFKNIVEDNIINGDIDTIVNDFNSILEDSNAFKVLNILIDHIYNADNNMDCLMNYTKNRDEFYFLLADYKRNLTKIK